MQIDHQIQISLLINSVKLSQIFLSRYFNQNYHGLKPSEREATFNHHSFNDLVDLTDFLAAAMHGGLHRCFGIVVVGFEQWLLHCERWGVEERESRLDESAFQIVVATVVAVMVAVKEN
ncbi:Hypothetical predicted protein [Olea europaea subsp. europaea]|uniref:Uncharacterized protein n=1 Tax=Olea europaea subsp. europaea TaxID=158383 RepID=A0A8S0PT86_OLEEU|nr:Hypothetical predicted protein [Olea europaea subsp. europaea]